MFNSVRSIQRARLGMLRVREQKSPGKNNLAGSTLPNYVFGNLLGTIFQVLVLFKGDKIINTAGIKIRRDVEKLVTSFLCKLVTALEIRKDPRIKE